MMTSPILSSNGRWLSSDLRRIAQAMVLLFVIAMIGDPYFVICGIAVGLLSRRPLHLLGATLIPIAWLPFQDNHSLADFIAPAFIVAFIWASASFLVKRALNA